MAGTQKFSDYPQATNPADYDDDSTFLLQNPTGYTKLGNLGDLKDTVLSDHNTLDEAYDEGGAGLGRTITADNGAVKIAGTDGFLISGIFGSGAAAELSGAGTRMLFNPAKAAFRAGYVEGAEWDDASIGDYSFAVGYSTEATGERSTAMGSFADASGSISTAMGDHTEAAGYASTAMGWNTEATSYATTAMGYWTHATGDYSTAMGNNTEAFSFGETAMGLFATVYSPASTIAWEATDRLFNVGNGTATGDRSDALTILKNGNTTIGGDLSVEKSSGDTTVVLENTGGGANVYQTFNSSNGTTDAYTVGVQKSTDKFFISDGTSLTATPRITIIPDGSVGVGTANPTSTLHAGGSFSAPYVAKTANYTATVNDYTIDATANSFTVTLPTAVGIAGRIYNIHNSGTGTITVDADGTETIEGDLTQEVNQWENLKIQSTGANWIVL